MRIQLLDDIPTRRGELESFRILDVTKQVRDKYGERTGGVIVKDDDGDSVFVRSGEFSIVEQSLDELD